jgi:hypothetical protein
MKRRAHVLGILVLLVCFHGARCRTCIANAFYVSDLATCVCGRAHYGYADDNVGPCRACRPNSGAKCPDAWNMECTRESNCICNAGYSGPTNGACTACAAGKYKNSHGTSACIDCLANQYSSAEASTACTPCAAGTTSLAAASACYCGAGKTGPTGGPCTPCAAGEYKAASGSAVCSTCAQGSVALTTGATACVACAGTYAPSPTTPCAACEEGSVAPSGSTSAAACVPAFTCDACPGGTYKSAYGRVPCEACPQFATSPMGSTNVSACVCGAGYGTNPF